MSNTVATPTVASPDLSAIKQKQQAAWSSGNYAVVGDLEGYVHWLSLSDGSFSARQRLGKRPVESAPVVAGNVVYVEDAGGRIGAYRTE